MSEFHPRQLVPVAASLENMHRCEPDELTEKVAANRIFSMQYKMDMRILQSKSQDHNVETPGKNIYPVHAGLEILVIQE